MLAGFSFFVTDNMFISGFLFPVGLRKQAMILREDAKKASRGAELSFNTLCAVMY